MTTIYQKSGSVITVTPTVAVAAGAIFQIGGLIGFAPKAIAANMPGEMIRRGQIKGKKPSALVVAQGDQLYYSATTGELNKTAAGNVAAGFAPSAFAAGVTDVVTVL